MGFLTVAASLGLATIAAVTADAKILGTPKYVVGGPKPPPGYVETSLQTVQSPEFAMAYNNNGLPDAGEVLTPGFCPQFKVREGLLLTGRLSNPSEVLPFTPDGLHPQKGKKLLQPVYLGPQAGTRAFVPLTSTEQANLFTRPLTPEKARYCNHSFHVLYERARFAMFGYGPKFSNGAPQSGARLVSLHDLKSPVFARSYAMTGGLGDFGESLGDNRCCGVMSIDGPLLIYGNQSGNFNGESSVTPYNAAGNKQCGPTLSTPLFLGTAAGSFFHPTVNGKVQAQFDAGVWPTGCTKSTNMFALYAVPEAPLPVPTPPPAAPACLEVDLQVSFYNPGKQGICLASAFRQVLTMNETYKSIPMDSVDECGFGIDVSTVVLKPYTSSQFYAYAGGATQCPCSGYGFVSYEGQTSKTTMCKHRYDEFHFCMVNIEYRKTVQCPPSPPK